LITYHGIGRTQPDGRPDVRTAPLFETGDTRYAWLNMVQAIGLGTAVGGAAGLESVTYDIYALR
jgi:hypothetical protein